MIRGDVRTMAPGFKVRHARLDSAITGCVP